MFDNFLINAVDEGAVVKVAFSLLALLGQDVTMISVLPLQMAAAGYLETLFGSGLGLHFWHFTISFKVLKMSYFFVDLGAIIICIRLPSSLGIISTLPNSSNSCANFNSITSPCSL